MSFSIPHLLVFLAVVILLFGTKKLRNLGSDLGASLKGFKKAMSDDEPADTDKSEKENKSDQLDSK